MWSSVDISVGIPLSSYNPFATSRENRYKAASNKYAGRKYGQLEQLYVTSGFVINHSLSFAV